MEEQCCSFLWWGTLGSCNKVGLWDQKPEYTLGVEPGMLGTCQKTKPSSNFFTTAKRQVKLNRCKSDRSQPLLILMERHTFGCICTHRWHSPHRYRRSHSHHTTAVLGGTVVPCTHKYLSTGMDTSYHLSFFFLVFRQITYNFSFRMHISTCNEINSIHIYCVKENFWPSPHFCYIYTLTGFAWN